VDQERFKWIVRCIDFDRLNEFEQKSIEICERQMKSKGDLSPRMEEILEEIHREKS
jgi:hypothetical protein